MQERFRKLSNQALTASINEAISDLSISHDMMEFPNRYNSQLLTAKDYTAFLSAFTAKRNRFNKKTNPFDLRLSANENNEEALLEGLIAYLQSLKNGEEFPATCITICGNHFSIKQMQALAAQFTKLKLPAINMADEFYTDTSSDDEQSDSDETQHSPIQKLINFIKDNDTIVIDLKLPSSQYYSDNQRELDNIYEQRTRKLNAAQLQNVISATSSKQNEARVIRKRNRIGKGNIAIDIEIQQEQQAERSRDTDSAATSSNESSQNDTDTKLMDLMTFNKLVTNQFRTGKHEGIFNKQSISDIPYFSKSSAISLWSEWFGITSDRTDRTIVISESACLELFTHSQRFQFGIDFDNLPAGFNAKIDPDQPNTLNLSFDKNVKLASVYNPLTVQCEAPVALQPVSFDDIEQWCSRADKETHRFIANWWKELLNDVIYDAEALRSFRMQLHRLASLPLDVLQSLKQLTTTDKSKFKERHFNYILNNYQKFTGENAVQVEAYPVDLKNILRIDDRYDEELQNCCRAINALPYDNHDSLLEQLSPNNLELIYKIKTRYLSGKTDGLLQVYNLYGAAGIVAIGELLDKYANAFNKQNTATAMLLGNMQSLVPLVTQRSLYENALGAIASFSEEKRAWWNTLATQHCSAQQTDELPHLVNAFKIFCEKLSSYGSEFTLPPVCQLNNIKSLPVALSRILTIIDDANVEDRLTQWQKIQEFKGNELDSREIVKAKREFGKNGEKWAFFHPEQKINLANSIASGGKYATQQNWKSIHKTPVDDNYRMRFFRYVAFQAKKGSLSLGFYSGVDERLQNSQLAPKIKSMLYSLLADATTKKEKTLFVTSTDSALQDAYDIINELELRKKFLYVSAEKIQEMLLATLRDLTTIPPLPILKHLLIYVSRRVNSVLDIRTIFNLSSALNELDVAVTKHGSIIYTGLKNYNEDDYKNDKLYNEFLDAIGAIDTTFKDDKPIAQALIKLISTFKIEKDRYLSYLNSTILEHCKDKQCKDNLLYLYEILNDVAYSNDMPPLNIKMLILLNKRLMAEKDIKSRNQVYNWLSQNINPIFSKKYFPENYFSRNSVARDAIPNDIKQKLLSKFSRDEANTVEKLLLYFGDNKDQNEFPSVIDAIAQLTADMEARKRKLCLDNLLEYTATQQLSMLELKQALDEIDRTNSMDYFNYFMAKVRISSIKEANLHRKLLAFISNTKPAFVTTELLESQFKLSLRSDTTALDAIYRPEDYENLGSKHETLKGVFQRQDDHLYIEQKNNLLGLHAYFDEGKITADENEEAAIFAYQMMKSSKPIPVALLSQQFGRFLNETKHTADLANQSLPDTEELANLIQAAHDNNAIHRSNENLIPLIQGLALTDASNFSLLVSQYPNLSANKDYIPLLLTNPAFHRELNSYEVNNLLEMKAREMDDDKINILLSALDDDLADFMKIISLSKRAEIECDKLCQYRASYTGTVAELYNRISQICANNLTSKKAFISLLEYFLESTKSNGKALLENSWNFVTKLEELFSVVTNKNEVLSLCVNFNNRDGEGFEPSELLTLIDYINIAPKHRELTTKIASSLINTYKQHFSLDDFMVLCTKLRCDNDSDQLAAVLAKYYDKPPYPPIEYITKWYTAAADQRSLIKDSDFIFIDLIKADYENWEKKPHETLAKNEFNTTYAKSQIQKFVPADSLTEQDCEDLDKWIKHYRTLTTDAIKQSLNTVDKNDYPQFIAIMSALLYRSHGDELDSTQYLDVLALLKGGKKITCGIKTGQGKTRIMMDALSLACLSKLGNTVDFLTADLVLALREYVSYQPFFDLLDIKTSMIYDESPISSYQLKGINFSDATNLSLFRNQAFSLGRGNEVLDDEENRFLVADEVDTLLYDVADTRFNYSTEGDESLKDIQWLYHHLILFFKPGHKIHDRLTHELYYDDIDLCRDEFINYVRSVEPDNDKINQLLSYNDRQLEQWQESAMIAWQLNFNEDFTISPDVNINSNSGMITSSVAKVLSKNRKLNNSKFSFGIHQCLHARLNYEATHIATLPEDTSPLYIDALKKCHYPFYIENEKQIIYSSTSKNLLDLYRSAHVLAVTGTPGSSVEREEATEFYDMSFIDAPTHLPMQGHEPVFHFYENRDEEAKFNGFLAAITKALANNQAILVICQDTNESKLLTQKLKASLAHLNPTYQEMGCDESITEEMKIIKEAGNPRTITVTTDRAGRGTNIQTHQSIKNVGLNVMTYYLPSTRDLDQIVGRTRRNAETGESHIFFDSTNTEGDNDLPAHHQQSDLKNVASYYQTRMDIRKLISRLIKNAVGDFRKLFTDDFYQNTPEVTKHFRGEWSQFMTDADQAWNTIQTKIQFITSDLPLSDEKIAQCQVELNAYQCQVNQYWKSFKHKCRTGKHNETLNVILSDQDFEIHLSKKAMELMKFNAQKPLFEHEPAPVAEAIAVPAQPKPTRAARFKQWLANHPIITGMLIGVTLTVIAAAVLAVICATYGIGTIPVVAFGSAIATAFTTSAVSTTTALVVGSCIAVAIGMVGAAILGAVGGLLAKLGIKRPDVAVSVRGMNAASSTGMNTARISSALSDKPAIKPVNTDHSHEVKQQDVTTSVLPASHFQHSQHEEVTNVLAFINNKLNMDTYNSNNNNNNEPASPTEQLKNELGQNEEYATLMNEIGAMKSANNQAGIIQLLQVNNAFFMVLNAFVQRHAQLNVALTPTHSLK